MRKRIVRPLLAVVLAVGVWAPSSALAARQQDDREIHDARYEGYPVDVNVASPGTGGAYFLWALLGVLALGVLFKDARRTHLD